MRIPDVAQRGFGSAAEVYERARPGYAAPAVAWMCERLRIGSGRDVLDLAAGTGKLTRSLVPAGARVIAVEPVEEMRAQLLEAVPGVEALAGTAEEIPLPDVSVDAVVCGQAFHWFDADRALPEIHRVLRPGGGLGLVWNSRDLGDSLQARLDEVLETVRERSSRYWNEESSALVPASPFFGELEHRSWPSEQHLSLEGVLEMVASRSYVGSLDEDARREVLERVREVVADEPEPIVLRYVVDVFVADRQ